MDSGIRRRCHVVFQTKTPSPQFLKLLEDDNARWQVYLGIDTLEPMGLYFLRDLAIDETGQNTGYRVSLQDESALVAERKTTQAYTFSNDLIDVCKTLLSLSGRALNFTGLNSIDVQLSNYFVDFDKDPVAAVQQLLEGYGYEMLMDLTGNCMFRAIPGEPSNTKSPDISDITLLKQINKQRRSANHIIVTSDGISRGDWYDLNPASPTYVYGPYGDVPETFSVSDLLSNEACLKAAERISYKKFARQATHTFAAIQIPKVELGDGWTYDGMRYTADQLAFSLIHSRPMYLTGRGVSV